jgi:PKHD-type hydroxylase
MIILRDVLTAAEVRHVCERLKAARFVDGRAQVATPMVRDRKSNTQADLTDPAAIELAGFVRKALERHGTFMAYAQPVRWTQLRFARYAEGNRYGAHIDRPVMDTAEGPMRSDLSFTLYLADPASYDGGELMMERLDGQQRIKLPPGAMVVYPTTVSHGVTPVTRGERLVCIGWVQSLLRRGDHRELVFDLSRLRPSHAPGTEQSQLLEKSISNLVRMWGEP